MCHHVRTAATLSWWLICCLLRNLDNINTPRSQTHSTVRVDAALKTCQSITSSRSCSSQQFKPTKPARRPSLTLDCISDFYHSPVLCLFSLFVISFSFWSPAVDKAGYHSVCELMLSIYISYRFLWQLSDWSHELAMYFWVTFIII